MRIPTFGGVTQNTIGLVLAIAALLAAAAGGAMAIPTVREEVISSIGMEQARSAWRITNSRLTVPPGAEWATALGSGPLALTVESGRIRVVLDGGLARIERRPQPLVAGFIRPLETGSRTALLSGDQLVIDRGVELHVTNDDDVGAVAMLLRGRYVPPPTKYGAQ